MAREARRAKTLALPRLAAACPKSMCRFGRPRGHIITFSAPGGTGKVGKAAMARMAMAMALEWSASQVASHIFCLVESQCHGAVHAHIPIGHTWDSETDE